MISAILDHLWQSTLLAVAIAGLALAFRKARASVRYGLWLTASVKFLVPFAALAALGRLLAPEVRPPAQATTDVGFIARAAAPLSNTAITPHLGALPDPALVLLGVWALGVAVVLIVWTIRGARIRPLRRLATPVALAAPMPVMTTPTMMEPGLVGLWRPVLLIPETLFEHLDRPGIEALVAHEACHYRRKDNLTAAIHMLVEALFWFHPMVWWIGGRLVEERERACDEAVVRAGHDREVYAESLLECCRLFLQSPLRCVAGASGSNLSRRVEMIMTLPLKSPLSRPGKAVLIAAGICALASPVAAGWLTSPAERQVVSRALTMASSPASTLADEPPAAASTPDRIETAKVIATAGADAAPVARAQRTDALGSEPIQLDPIASVTLSRAPVGAGVGDVGRLELAQLQTSQPEGQDTAPAAEHGPGAGDDPNEIVCRKGLPGGIKPQLCMTRKKWAEKRDMEQRQRDYGRSTFPESGPSDFVNTNADGMTGGGMPTAVVPPR